MLELKQRLLHVWHGIEQTIIDNAIDEWRGRLRAYVPAKGRHFEQQYCCDNIQPYDKRRFSFCQKRHDFSIVFFWKLPQIRTSNFRKVVRQQTDGMLGMVLLEIYFSFQQWKNFENPLRIDKVTAMSLVYTTVSDTQCI